MKVYFDNLVIHRNKGHLLEEDQYYPFGLKMAGFSDQALPIVPNNYLYNGRELQQNEFSNGSLSGSDGTGLEDYDYGFSGYDPQIARFTEQDPLTDNFAAISPYPYALNDPVANIDEDGLSLFNILCPGTSGFSIFLMKFGDDVTQIAHSPLTRMVSIPATSLRVAGIISNTLTVGNELNNSFMAEGVGMVNGTGNNEPDDPLATGMIGQSADRNGGEYSRVNNGEPSNINTSDLASKSNDQLLKMVHSLLLDGTISDVSMRSVALTMFSQFETKNGGIFSNNILDEKIANSSEFSNFLNSFNESFRNALAVTGGDIKKILQNPISLNRIAPIFHDHFNGLGITVDAVNHLIVYLDGIIRSGDRYSAEITIIMKDMFGLDKGDIKRYGGLPFVGKDFKAWWLLQHTRGYRPLHTFIKITTTIFGKIP